MALSPAAAAFIGASVTLVLVIIFMILMVILVRQCLAFLAKRNAIRAQVETQRQARDNFERQRRGSITEPVPATFDWHHSIRIAGTPPPSYHEAKKLPSIENLIAIDKDNRDNDSSGSGENTDSEAGGEEEERGSTTGSRRVLLDDDTASNHETVQVDVDTIANGGHQMITVSIEEDEEGVQRRQDEQMDGAGSHDLDDSSHDPNQEVHIDVEESTHL